MGKGTILLIKQVLVLVVVVAQLIEKGRDQQLKIVLLLLLLLLLVCQLEVTMEDVMLIAARGNDDSFNLIQGEYICTRE